MNHGWLRSKRQAPIRRKSIRASTPQRANWPRTARIRGLVDGGVTIDGFIDPLPRCVRTPERPMALRRGGYSTPETPPPHSVAAQLVLAPHGIHGLGRASFHMEDGLPTIYRTGGRRKWGRNRALFFRHQALAHRRAGVISCATIMRDRAARSKVFHASWRDFGVGRKA